MNLRLHSLYSRTERLKRWFSARFTPLGKMVLLVMLVSSFFGLNIQSTMIYQIFAVTSCALLLSFLLTLRFSPTLLVTRYLPESCVVGERVRYRIVVTNNGSKPTGTIHFQENVRCPLPTQDDFNTLREEGEDLRNVFDRRMAYYRWLWLIRIGRRLRGDMQPLPALAASAKKEVEVELVPLARGSAHLEGYLLVRIDPLGLCKREVLFPDSKNILVLPRLYEVGKLLFHGARKYHQGGITMAHDRGDSHEFLSLREYVHGDPVKHIDWKSTARSGRTTVKQYRDEYFSRYGLVLDSFTDQHHSDIFEEAVSIAASIMMSQDSMNSVLDLLFVGRECVTCTVGSGLASQQKMLEMLASVSPCRDRNFSEMTALLQSHAALLSGIVLVLVDFDEERRAAINYLASHRIPARVILVGRDGEGLGEDHDSSLVVPIHRIDYEHVQEQLLQL